MKNIFKSLIFFSAGLMLFSACEDEDAIRIPDTLPGATMRIQVDPAASFWNFAEIGSAAVKYSLFTENQNIDRIELYMVYTPVGGASTDRMLFQTYQQSDFDAEGAIRDIQVSSQTLADFVGAPGGVPGLSGGDRVDIINITRLTDGRVFPDTVLQGTPFQTITSVAGDIAAAATTSFSVGFTAYIACPTTNSDWVGDYSSMAQNVTAFCGSIDCNATRDVSISFKGTPEPFRYSVTNHDGGYWCSYAPGSCDRPADFYDICLTPLFLGATAQTGFGGHQDLGTSTRDAATGVIVFRWCNDLNPVCGETVFTPK